MKSHKTLGGALLVAGTSIGAGMLALPVITAQGGFIYATFIFFISYIVMTLTGFFYTRLTLSLPEGANIISMTEAYLGRGGKLFTWFFYLFLFYSLCIAYITGGGDLFYIFSQKTLSPYLCILLFTALFSLFVFFGAFWVDWINRVLMAGLIFTYFGFVFSGVSKIDLSFLLSRGPLLSAASALPIILISFGYQGIVPSLVNYLDRDVKKVDRAILMGTTLTLVIYIIWEMITLGIIPLEAFLQAVLDGKSTVFPLSRMTHSSVLLFGQYFGFFALTTSFLGVSLGLFDFLADGLKLKKRGKEKLLLFMLTFLPPLLISLIYPNLFLKALAVGGGIGGVVLLVFLPTLLLYKASKKGALRSGFSNRILLGVLFLIVAIDFFLEFFHKAGV